MSNETKACLCCGQQFPKSVTVSRRDWEKTKYCSKRCAKYGKKLSPSHRERIGLAGLGRKHRPDSIAKMRGENCHLWRGGLTAKKKLCPKCGGVKPNPYARFCSVCYMAQNFGPSSPNWRGGTTSENSRIRNSKKYSDWRRSVFTRDSYTCVKCGQIGGELNADHIKPFSLFPELRLELTNGRTLCLECHKLTDTYCGRTRRCAEIKP